MEARDGVMEHLLGVIESKKKLENISKPNTLPNFRAAGRNVFVSEYAIS